jgi:phosphohistidine phosphatase
MRLYFVRHADAVPGGDDAARPLSDKGERDAVKMGRYLARLDTKFDAAYSSPLVRARQTAEFILKACPLPKGKKLELTEALTNDTSWNSLQRWLASLPKADNILLVGHAPSIDEHASRLLGISDPAALSFPKGAVACLETEDLSHAELKLFLGPKRLP